MKGNCDKFALVVWARARCEEYGDRGGHIYFIEVYVPPAFGADCVVETTENRLAGINKHTGGKWELKLVSGQINLSMSQLLTKVVAEVKCLLSR